MFNTHFIHDFGERRPTRRGSCPVDLTLNCLRLSQILQSQVHAMLEHAYSFSMNFNKHFETWLNTVFSMFLSMFHLCFIYSLQHWSTSHIHALAMASLFGWWLRSRESNSVLFSKRHGHLAACSVDHLVDFILDTTVDGQHIQILQQVLCWTSAPPNLNDSARVLPKVMLAVTCFSSIGANALQVTLTLNFGGEGVVPDRRGLNIMSMYGRCIFPPCGYHVSWMGFRNIRYSKTIGVSSYFSSRNPGSLAIWLVFSSRHKFVELLRK